MSKLRLPSNWHTFTFNQKQWYLVNTHQAHDISEASVLLAQRTRRSMRAAFKKVLDACAAPTIRLPYADS